MKDMGEFLELYLSLDEAHKTAIGQMIIAAAETNDLSKALESVSDEAIRAEYKAILDEQGILTESEGQAV